MIHPFHHGILHISEQVVDEVGTENAKGAVCRRVMDSFSDEYRFQVLGCKNCEKSEKIKKEQNVCKTQEKTQQDSDPVRHTIISKEDAADEGEGREQNGKTLCVVEAIKLLAIGTAVHLKVKCHDQDKGCQDSLDVGTQSVREHNHDGENGFSRHNHRLPEDVLLTVGSIDETGHVVDPAILVII